MNTEYSSQVLPSDQKIIRPKRSQIILRILTEVSDPYRIEKIAQEDLLSFCVIVRQAMDYDDNDIIRSYFIQKLYDQTRRKLEVELNTL